VWRPCEWLWPVGLGALEPLSPDDDEPELEESVEEPDELVELEESELELLLDDEEVVFPRLSVL
jgi:hypothetical protein